MDKTTGSLGRGQHHPSITLIDAQELASHLGVSTWALAEWQRKGLLPRPTVRLAPNVLRWRLGDVEGWLSKLARSPYVPPSARGAVRMQQQRRAGRPLRVRLHPPEYYLRKR
jgi:predicted DNA-binding transcriptional regulator AlpA